jgi:hypothetical protein
MVSVAFEHFMLTVIMLNVVMLSVIMLSVIMVSVMTWKKMLFALASKSWWTLTSLVLWLFMLSVIYAECHLYWVSFYAECHYAECRYAECHYAIINF